MRYTTAKEKDGKLVYTGYRSGLVMIIALIALCVLLIGAVSAIAAPPMDESVVCVYSGGRWYCVSTRYADVTVSPFSMPIPPKFPRCYYLRNGLMVCP